MRRRLHAGCGRRLYKSFVDSFMSRESVASLSTARDFATTFTIDSVRGGNYRAVLTGWLQLYDIV